MHRLVITKEGTVSGRRSISFRCADPGCDNTGDIQSSPHATADQLFEALGRFHNDPDLFDSTTEGAAA